MRLIRRLLLNSSITLISLLCTLVCLEVVFRVFDWRGYHAPRTRDWGHALLPETDLLPGVFRQFVPNTEFELAYDSNPRGYFDSNNGLRYRINKFGLRGPDFALEKEAGTLRIVLLGDSFVFGEGVKWQDTLGEQLEVALSAKLDRSVEVLNVAVGGWSTVDEIAYLSQRGLHFKPDVVLVVYVLNDAEYAANLDLWNDFRAEWEFEQLSKRSYFLSFVAARLALHFDSEAYAKHILYQALEDREAWRRSLTALNRGNEISSSAGAGFAVAVFPFIYMLDESYPFKVVHDMLLKHCADNDLTCIDLLPSFLGQDFVDLWVHPSDQHPNERGHALAAKALATFLLESNTLPK